MPSNTEWVVYCTTHRHYLVYEGVTGATWTADQATARRYTKRQATAAAETGTWLDHKPTPWAVTDTTPALLGDDADDEHGAWTDACDKLNDLLRSQHATGLIGSVEAFDVNDPRCNQFVDAIRYWGETLVALRSGQPEETRARALREAGRLVREGRPVRRG